MPYLHATRDLKVKVNFPWKCDGIFRKVTEFIFRLTPQNLKKSLVFSPRLFLSVSQFDVNFPLFAMHATTTKCKTIALMPVFRSKYSVLIGLFNWDQLKLMT